MTITIVPIPNIPEVRPGDDLAALLAEAVAAARLAPADGDVVVVTQKVVSKAEGRMVAVAGPPAKEALIGREAAQIIRRRGSLVIARTRHGFVCANAGVDVSNVAEGWAVLLPVDPDKSANTIRVKLERAWGVRLGIVISDTFGRAWRRGQVNVAIGVAGMPAVLDLRGTPDAGGRILEATEIAVADEAAGAAELAMGKSRRVPAVIIRGLDLPAGAGRAADLVRPPDEDLFL